MYDVIIIGAGVSGCAIARQLSQYTLHVAVLESSSDVCEGTSKANSGIVHAGYDAIPGTLKARLNVEGSARMPALAKELDFPYRQEGTLVLSFKEEDLHKLEELKQRGISNGITDLRILNRQEVLEMEPEAGDTVQAALFAPTGAVVCPFGLTIAFAENAAVNGVTFFFNTKVETIIRKESYYVIQAGECQYEAKVIINAAGIFADEIHNMVSAEKLKIIPRKGEYLLYDKEVGNLISHTLFQLPTSLGKGVLVTPTVHGNLLIGPTASDISDKEGVDTTSEGIVQIQEKAALSIKKVPSGSVITSFAGLRAHLETNDFLIQEIQDAPGFIDVAGIESPGLSCAPAIGRYVTDIVKSILPLEEKKDFVCNRKGIKKTYGNVVCRCEMITEGEVLDAIHRPLGATTVDGIKRRTRAGFGRCQSGFCNPRVVELLARELGVDESEIRKSEGKSYYLLSAEVDS